MAAGVGLALAPVADATPSSTGINARNVAAYWTAARMAAAVPRDIVTDGNGHWYLPRGDGSLHAYGANSSSTPIASKGKPGGSGAIGNAVWTKGGAVETATGRLYFSMAGSDWVCSGTTVTDSNTSVSLILTAAHCVYDDANGAFSSNVLFIPDLAASGTHTSGTCQSAYVDGCWEPAYGVVDSDWTAHAWPDNIPWDYGLYVVPDTGAHTTDSVHYDDQALDALGPLAIAWDSSTVTLGALTDAIGYSYKYDPQLMYCEQGLQGATGVYGTVTYTNRWLSGCRLSGGSSGGPWMAASAAGAGPVISLNSWGYQGKPGMAGPNLQLAEPRCVYDAANSDPTPTETGGYVAHCAG